MDGLVERIGAFIHRPAFAAATDGQADDGGYECA